MPILLTTLAMLAFAANSILCREALASGHIGASAFTLLRIVSGAVVLSLLLFINNRCDKQRGQWKLDGSWISAAALFAYAAGFSFAYLKLSTGTGALLLFGAVQITMIAFALWKGERLTLLQLAGATLAAAGLVWLMLPSVESPPLLAALIMVGAGIAWGVYSLLGRGAKNPTEVTAGNFIRAVPFAFILFFMLGQQEHTSAMGVMYAIASGALASGLGYALWYAVLPLLTASTAATVQLSVPIIAALGGVVLLDEAMTLRFILASLAVLGGIALFVLNKRKTTMPSE
ncbi:MAG: DMT family transporter [Oleibacter sp.]|nr:DMT family transporter [Thalassolituus sp.]